MRRFMGAALASAGLFASASAGAQSTNVHDGIPDILAVDNSMSGSYDLARLNYGEPSGLSALPGYSNSTPNESKYSDTEYGYLNGAGVAISYMADESLWGVPIRDIYARASYRWAYGMTAYNGSTEPPGSVPIQTTDEADVQEVDARLGKGFEAAPSWLLTPYVGGGFHLWERKSGYGTPWEEDYKDGYLGAGQMIQYAPASRFVVTGNALIGAMINPSMQYNQPGYLPVDHGLGGGPVIKAGAEIDWRFWRRSHFFAGFDYEHFSYIGSPISFGAMEPQSHTNDAVWSAGLRQSF